MKGDEWVVGKCRYTQEELENLHYTPEKRNKRLIDLTGKTFYEWTVIEQAPPDDDGSTRWKCRCSCGKLGLVRGYDLRNGKHKSCGHDRDHGLEDLTGMQFGELTVIGRAPNDMVGKVCWNCIDKEGNKKILRTQDLKDGKTKPQHRIIDLTGKQLGDWVAIEYLGDSMWKCQNVKTKETKDVHSYSLRNYNCYKEGYEKPRQFEDLTGKRFNEWEVIRHIGGRHTLWECRCSCGEIRQVAAYDLKTGKSRNCGHNRNKPIVDLTGRKFGKLTVLKYIGKGKYLCSCSCNNNIKEYIGSNLVSGSTISCGCAHRTIYTKEYMSKLIDDYIDINKTKPTKQDLADLCNVTYTYISQLIDKYEISDKINTKFGSSYEKEIYDEILKIKPGIKISIHDRTILRGNEIDLYLPEYKLGIEFNGNYWHSALFKEQNYHQDKTIEAAKHRVRLISIFEYEWLDWSTRNKLIGMIRSLIVQSENKIIYARNCEIRKVENGVEREFLYNYHLQKYVPSHVAYGLYENNQLISIMTFGKPRMDNNAEWEIIRYCSIPEVAVVGGAERLFKAFINEYKPKTVISYCDISKFIGNVYKKLKMKTSLSNITPPNYKWVNFGTSEVVSRYKSQKQKLIEQGLGEYGETENEIMTNLGYIKVYDCGNLKFKWEEAL